MIVATVCHDGVISRQRIAPPHALVDQVQAIMGSWWQRSAPYPVGRLFGSTL
jgi:hypothetical protein